MSDAQTMMRYDANKKSVLVAYILWFFFCMLGVHRFYLGRTGSGAAILVLTLISFPLMIVAIGFLTILIPMIWCFVDLFLIPGITQQYNNQLAQSLS